MNDHDQEALKRAKVMAGRSPDPSTQVGAVVYDGNSIHSGACNHFPRGTPDAFWSDRETKYAHVVHAEAAAIVAAGRLGLGATLLCTAHPCVQCATLAVTAGIKKVICPKEPWRDAPEVRLTCERADSVFARAGIEVEYV